jgi:hypothetical protein
MRLCKNEKSVLVPWNTNWVLDHPMDLHRDSSSCQSTKAKDRYERALTRTHTRTYVQLENIHIENKYSTPNINMRISNKINLASTKNCSVRKFSPNMRF